MAGSAISLMLLKAVTAWFAAGTDEQFWGVTSIAYFRPETGRRVHFRTTAAGKLLSFLCDAYPI